MERLGYLRRPRWCGATWDSLKDQASIPADAAARAALFAAEACQVAAIQALRDDCARLDAPIDERVLDLYGRDDPADRQRILGSAPVADEDGEAAAEPEATA